jgi:hypothetical protein
MKMDMAIFTYDIPRNNASAYGRVRRKTRGFSTMLNWSAYLIPLSMRDAVKEILEEEKKKTPGVVYHIAKFDSSEEENLKKMVRHSLSELLNKSKEALLNAIEEVRGEEETLDHGHKAVGKAKKCLREAQTLATVFMMTNDMAHALASYENIITAKSNLLDELKNQARSEAQATANVEVQAS